MLLFLMSTFVEISIAQLQRQASVDALTPIDNGVTLTHNPFSTNIFNSSYNISVHHQDAYDLLISIEPIWGFKATVSTTLLVIIDGATPNPASDTDLLTVFSVGNTEFFSFFVHLDAAIIRSKIFPFNTIATKPSVSSWIADDSIYGQRWDRISDGGDTNWKNTNPRWNQQSQWPLKFEIINDPINNICEYKFYDQETVYRTRNIFNKSFNTLQSMDIYIMGDTSKERYQIHTVEVEQYHIDTAPTIPPITIATNTPTNNPTDIPSTSPTLEIITTNIPSITPTDVPSTSPTDNPSTSPTLIPSITPSNNPSITPSDNPSITPSIALTGPPSSIPTINPSLNPSTHPIIHPLLNLTSSPSIEPRIITIAPSLHPITTISPSHNPTEHPTHYPSLHPTTTPSQNPTEHPVFSITPYPTLNPVSEETTSDPSTSPISNPSTSPISTSPTPYHSIIPTTESPTEPPSILPTSGPITSPTSIPITPSIETTEGALNVIQDEFDATEYVIVVVIFCSVCFIGVLILLVVAKSNQHKNKNIMNRDKSAQIISIADRKNDNPGQIRAYHPVKGNSANVNIDGINDEQKSYSTGTTESQKTSSDDVIMDAVADEIRDLKLKREHGTFGMAESEGSDHDDDSEEEESFAPRIRFLEAVADGVKYEETETKDDIEEDTKYDEVEETEDDDGYRDRTQPMPFSQQYQPNPAFFDKDIDKVNVSVNAAVNNAGFIVHPPPNNTTVTHSTSNDMESSSEDSYHNRMETYDFIENLQVLREHDMAIKRINKDINMEPMMMMLEVMKSQGTPKTPSFENQLSLKVQHSDTVDDENGEYIQ